jgi:two-component system cell cycle response regulator
MEKENLSILIIDPEKEDHRLIRDSLQRSKVPASIEFAASTEKGLDLLERRKFDLILTDHALPEANAYQLLSELQQRELLLPVIVLTRDGEARTAREAFQKGIDDYLLKEELATISFFDVIGNVIEKRREKEEQAKREFLLREQAERDGLTGLYNHRYFLEALEREFARSRRYRRPLSLMMLDLDGFKSINDACGHQQGDQVLKGIARLLLQSVRFVDLAARYGGDEFVVLLPETELRQAARAGKRILEEIHRNPFLFEDKIFPLSASIGIASYRPDQVRAGCLLKEADQALYEAKRRGRNRVIIDSQRQNDPPSLSP